MQVFFANFLSFFKFFYYFTFLYSYERFLCYFLLKTTSLFPATKREMSGECGRKGSDRRSAGGRSERKGSASSRRCARAGGKARLGGQRADGASGKARLGGQQAEKPSKRWRCAERVERLGKRWGVQSERKGSASGGSVLSEWT